tara:strand:+ start:366 stop:614 length:249 start_codon:yes stop_codon:yes gene_type:complete
VKDKVSFSIKRKEHETLDFIGKFLGLKQKRPAHKTLTFLIDKFLQDNHKEITNYIEHIKKAEQLSQERKQSLKKIKQKVYER